LKSTPFCIKKVVEGESRKYVKGKLDKIFLLNSIGYGAILNFEVE